MSIATDGQARLRKWPRTIVIRDGHAHSCSSRGGHVEPGNGHDNCFYDLSITFKGNGLEPP